MGRTGRARRKRVTFTATKRVPTRSKVSFTTSEGKRVSFVAKTNVPKKVKVSFLTKKK